MVENILPIMPTLHEYPVGVQVVMQMCKIPHSLASEILGMFCRQRCIHKTPALPFKPVSLTIGHTHTYRSLNRLDLHWKSWGPAETEIHATVLSSVCWNCCSYSSQITVNVTELRLQGKHKRANTAEYTALEVIFMHVPKGLRTSTFFDIVKIK